jgi:hypothetical protein
MRVYVIYVTLLALSIGLSQLWGDKHQARRGYLSTVVPALIYALLGVVDDPDKRLVVMDFVRYYLKLVGLEA